ncbi:MAG: restriction endonuclease [Planctomycetes bacterium]|nr:restriction endonuclease [Planctomycetota bacterium]
MTRHEPQLTKTTGESEPFKEQKLRRSLTRSGADPDQVDEVVREVTKRLRDGMATTEVFRIAHRLLRRERRAAAARYSLQRAIQQLGPDGIPFEKFIAELWRSAGFRTRTGVRLQGRFVRHEVDIIAKRGDDSRFAECKFRSQNDGKVDIKVALYVFARAADIRTRWEGNFWLVTNGRFTKDALTYGEGVGLQLLAWDHPQGAGLRDQIDRAGLHPVTAISTLHHKEQLALLRRGIVLAAALRDQRDVIHELGISDRRSKELWREIDELRMEK